MFLLFLKILFGTILGMLAGAGALHAIPRLGRAGKIFSESLCRAPGLDFVVTYFTILPLVYGAAAGGWIGLLAGVIGAVGGMLIWQFVHEQMHAEAVKGPRIIKVLNR